MIGPSAHQDLSTDLGNNNKNNNNNHDNNKDNKDDDDVNTSRNNKKTKKTTDCTNNNGTTTSPSNNSNNNNNNTAIKGHNRNDENDNTRESSGSPMAKGPYPVGPSSSPSGTVTAPPSPPSARSMAAPARNDPGGDDVEFGELLGGELHDFDDEGWSPEDADLMAAFLEDDFSGEILFGLDTTSSPTAASAVADQPGSVPSCPMAEFDDYTLDLLAASGVISGAPGVAMPSTSVGAGADASDVATGASDVGAALPRTPTTPPAPGPMPAFGLTSPIAADKTSDTNVLHPPSISSTLAAPFPMTTATPTFAPSPDSVASTAMAAKATVAAAAEAAAAVAAATSSSSTFSTSAFAISPVPGTPSTSEGPRPATTAGSTPRQFGLDTTSSPTAASAVSDQPGSVPSCPMAEIDDHTLDLLAASGVISGAPGVAMPSTSVGAGADASDVATGASDVGAALPTTPTTPPVPGPMPAFGLTSPIAADTSSDTNVLHPLAISSTLAAPFTSTTATPSFVPSPITDSVAPTAVAAKATVAAAVTTGSTTSEITTLTPPPAPTSALNNSRIFSAVTT
ncbi:unnamed protein product, partial [Ectocarpus sp. 8 AP-2014]